MTTLERTIQVIDPRIDRAVEKATKPLLERIEKLEAERDRIERNRDMWREQCNRQADQLRGTRSVTRPHGGGAA